MPGSPRLAVKLSFRLAPPRLPRVQAIIILAAVWFRYRRRQPQAERGARSDDGTELHRAIVPLHDLVGLCQPDSAAAFVALGGVVEFENFLLCCGRNAAALVQHFGDNHFAEVL